MITHNLFVSNGTYLTSLPLPSIVTVGQRFQVNKINYTVTDAFIEHYHGAHNHLSVEVILAENEQRGMVLKQSLEGLLNTVHEILENKGCFSIQEIQEMLREQVGKTP